jgi:hypothetical protein
MKLPYRVQAHGIGWTRFLSCVVLDVILMLTVFIGPPTALWLSLSPHTFWERLACVVVTGCVTLITALCAFMGGAWFITKTTGW